MESRKLIKLGASSFAVALPSEWIKKSKLKKGDSIFLENKGNGELIVSPNHKEINDEKKIEIETEGKTKENIEKNLHAAYIKGYNIIEFKKGKEKKDEIKEILKEYLSLEIIDSDDKAIIAKDFFNIKEADFKNFVRRIDTNLRDMFSLVIEQLSKEKIDSKSLKEILEIDESINKFYFLCSRIFTKGIDNPAIISTLKINSNDLFNNWWISYHLESLGDGLKYFLKWVHKLNPEKRDNILNIIKRLQQNYIKSIDSFYKEDIKKTSESLEETRKIKSEIENLEKSNPELSQITQALNLIEKNTYQSAKMIFYFGV